MAEVFHYDLYGLRAAKYQFLLENTLSSVPWQKLKAQPPQYFFAAKNFENKAEYERGFSVPEIFPANSVGIVTARDEIFINDSTEMLLQKIENYFHIQADKKCVKNIAYRPFDNKLIYYDADKLERPRKKVMRHFLPGNNIGLVTCRQSATNNWTLVNITNHIVDDSYVSNRTKERGYIFPLYLYPFDDSNERRPNLNMEIVNALAKITGLSFTSEKQEDENTFAPIDLLDYIYAVLYSNNYRAKYREFLKIDFPRVPCPENAEQFQ
ncbi:MAG: DNA methyltransferase, partial [Treponema sp.]|nr:DNA methyltransferase [Treponema sp.]